MPAGIAEFLYLAAGVLFILALRGLSSPRSARAGNRLAIAGMTLAVLTTLVAAPPADAFGWILVVLGLGLGGGIGAAIARRVTMTALPQLVAAFHSGAGLAAVFVAAAALYAPHAFGIGTAGVIPGQSLAGMSLGAAIGAIAVTGSAVVFARLNGSMSGAPVLLHHRHWINAGIALLTLLLAIAFCSTGSRFLFWLLVVNALVLGGLIIVPVGGTGMPVVVSMLNACSGWAAAGIGFTLGNLALTIAGGLVGASGAVLSYAMCRGMNRSFLSVMSDGFGAETGAVAGTAPETRPVRLGSPEDAALILRNAGRVIVVPGYGMAAARPRHALRQMADRLKAEGVEFRYAIHTPSGRMPGHMNVLLAEANVPSDEIFELEGIKAELSHADVAFVIGADDVIDPGTGSDRASPVFGTPPIPGVAKAGTVLLFVGRDIGTGRAGVENELFFRGNTTVLSGDAGKVVEEIVRAL